MTTRLHHIHASVIHAPISLIPAAALVDLLAARSNDRVQARLGRKLWWYATGSAALAGVAGMAASQEVEARSRTSEATMWLHGMANVALLAGTVGMAAWRQRHRPTITQSLVALGGVALIGYSSWLGGMLVYEHGAGVSAMPKGVGQGVGQSTRVLSRKAPFAFVRDAFRGLSWLLSRSPAMLRDRRNLGRAAVAETEQAPPPPGFGEHEIEHGSTWA